MKVKRRKKPKVLPNDSLFSPGVCVVPERKESTLNRILFMIHNLPANRRGAYLLCAGILALLS